MRARECTCLDVGVLGRLIRAHEPGLRVLAGRRACRTAMCRTEPNYVFIRALFAKTAFVTSRQDVTSHPIERHDNGLPMCDRMISTTEMSNSDLRANVDRMGNWGMERNKQSRTRAAARGRTEVETRHLGSRCAARSQNVGLRCEDNHGRKAEATRIRSHPTHPRTCSRQSNLGM